MFQVGINLDLIGIKMEEGDAMEIDDEAEGEPQDDGDLGELLDVGNLRGPQDVGDLRGPADVDKVLTLNFILIIPIYTLLLMLETHLQLHARHLCNWHVLTYYGILNATRTNW